MNMLRTRIAAHVKSIRHSALQSPVQMQRPNDGEWHALDMSLHRIYGDLRDRLINDVLRYDVHGPKLPSARAERHYDVAQGNMHSSTSTYC
ncbi:hypothetical protein SCLCIDRAFT_921414 [Scleroderma citrinum Foug A]|uniref:Uncharacterized protein n=1 Tax=Scleroderma citrinum Foug A TaxID=1036808 RepID=A0A0C3DY12_9AGAM|nr:hypothetical protein SCLCIDRAFT_921414 [Scleroderma citrinum Foug A]